MKPLVQLGRQPDDCWRWLGPVDAAGYGRKTFGGRDVLAHRWIWMQLFGPIPDGLVVSNRCGTIGCLNPHHLQCVTQAEACRNGANATLTPSDVREIRNAQPRSTVTAEILAERFGVTRSLVFDIWGRRAWAKAKPFHGPRNPRNQHSDRVSAEATP